MIYRWIRRFPKVTGTPLQLPYLQEEEHIYRGPMKHFRKHGNGVYIIVKKFSDNSEKVKSVRGEWIQDIMKKGTLVDENGKEQYITSNVLMMNMRSKKMITPYLDKNQTIERIRTKSVTSQQILQQNTNSGNSISSIFDKNKV